MTVTPITSLAQFKELINSGKVVLIDFYADWCGPCRMISPFFEKFATQNENVEFYKVDIDRVPDIAQEVGVRSIPLFHAYKNNEKVEEVLGANQGALTALVQKAVSLA